MAYSSTLKIGAIYSSTMSVNFQTMRRHISEDIAFQRVFAQAKESVYRGKRFLLNAVSAFSILSRT
jgi:hypothetical protein